MTCTGVCRYHPCPDCAKEEDKVGFPEDYLVFCNVCGRRGCVCDDAPRASVMPEHLPSVDPLFLDAVFKEFAPEDIREKTVGS